MSAGVSQAISPNAKMHTPTQRIVVRVYRMQAIGIATIASRMNRLRRMPGIKIDRSSTQQQVNLHMPARERSLFKHF